MRLRAETDTLRRDMEWSKSRLSSKTDAPACRRTQPDCLTAKEVRAIAGTAGPVRWLSFPRSMGYEQNPISVYYCYDKGAPICGLARAQSSAPSCVDSERGVW